MADTTTATIRTTWNGTMLTAIIVAVSRITGWDIKVDDLAPYVPLAVPVIAVFYRASLAAGERWPTLGRILFGRTVSPVYPQNGA